MVRPQHQAPAQARRRDCAVALDLRLLQGWNEPETSAGRASIFFFFLISCMPQLRRNWAFEDVGFSYQITNPLKAMFPTNYTHATQSQSRRTPCLGIMQRSRGKAFFYVLYPLENAGGRLASMTKFFSFFFLFTYLSALVLASIEELEDESRSPLGKG
jgi:hypothetical protein